ncbi:hypothetical protein scyTo_0019738, partial [Scyliorhinus torazame]|nr:hypothetical protein [Scyliorhinus torazame]
NRVYFTARPPGAAHLGKASNSVPNPETKLSQFELGCCSGSRGKIQLKLGPILTAVDISNKRIEDLIVSSHCDIGWLSKMEFASSHIYVSYPDNANQTELPGFNRNHPIGTVRNSTPGEDAGPHLYDPITASSTAAEDTKPVEASFYDPVEGGGPVYDNWTPEIAVIASKSVYDNMTGFSPSTGLHDQAISSPAAPNITTAERVYDVAEGSGSYIEKRKTSNSQTVQQPTKPPPLPAPLPPPLPPPRHRLGNNTNGPPPPLPPRPRNLKRVPDYVELIDSTPSKGFEHQALPTPCAPPLPDQTFLKQEKEELKGNTNVVLVNLGKLVNLKNVKPQKNAPVYCQSCSAAMSTFSKVQDLHAT